MTVALRIEGEPMMTTPEYKDAALSPNVIRMSENLSNIAIAMCAIQSQLKPIPKDGKNTQQGYKYAKFEDFVEHVRDILTKHDMFLVTTTSEPKRLEPRPTQKGGIQYGVEVRVTVRIMHKTGEWMEIDCYGEGQDSGDKAIYKAVTGGRKYALACLLGLSTTDDPEKDDDALPKKDYQTSQPRSGNGYQKNTNTYPKNNSANESSQKPASTNGAARLTTPPPAHNKQTGEIKPASPDEGGITFEEVMRAMEKANTVKELIEAVDMANKNRVIKTAEQKEAFTKLKDKMKGKIQG